MSKPFSNRELTNILMQPVHSTMRNAQGHIIREREGSVSRYEKHSHVVTHPQTTSTVNNTHTHAIQPKTPVTASQNSPVTHTLGATTHTPGHADVYRTMGYKFVDGHKVLRSSIRDPKITNNLANYMSNRSNVEGSSHIVRKSGRNLVAGSTHAKDSQVHYTSPAKAEHTVTGNPSLHYTSPPPRVNVASNRPNILHEHVKGHQTRVRVSEQKVARAKPVEEVATPKESRRVAPNSNLYSGRSTPLSEYNSCRLNQAEKSTHYSSNQNPLDSRLINKGFCNLVKGDNVTTGNSTAKTSLTNNHSLTNRTHKTFIFEGIKHDVQEGESITDAINRVTGKASKTTPRINRKSSEVIKPKRAHSPARATIDNHL